MYTPPHQILWGGAVDSMETRYSKSVVIINSWQKKKNASWSIAGGCSKRCTLLVTTKFLWMVFTEHGFTSGGQNWGVCLAQVRAKYRQGSTALSP